MNTAEPSCIVHQFQRFAEKLTGPEQQLLSRLEQDPRSYDADQEMAAVGCDSNKFFTLRSGWACSIR